jgi:hypothetical protein
MTIEALYDGKAKWLWVIDRTAERWLVSDWNGNERWIMADAVEAKPDLARDLGGKRIPVVRRIGTGKIAQYFRFERKDGASVTRGMEEDR